MKRMPKCDHHEATVQVTAGTVLGNERCASCWICSRPECVEDAIQWARDETGIQAVLVVPQAPQQ